MFISILFFSFLEHIRCSDTEHLWINNHLNSSKVWRRLLPLWLQNQGCLDCYVICISKKMYKVQLVFEMVLMSVSFPELQLESNDRKWYKKCFSWSIEISSDEEQKKAIRWWIKSCFFIDLSFIYFLFSWYVDRWKNC